MTLNEIRQQVANAPTMMDIGCEMRLLKQLMDIPVAAVHENLTDFDAIMDRLYESHSQAFFDVDDSNLPTFLGFARWLELLALTEPSETGRISMLALAEHFRIDPQTMPV